MSTYTAGTAFAIPCSGLWLVCCSGGATGTKDDPSKRSPPRSAVPKITGQVTATSPSPESIDYALITISFKNEGRVAARVVRYEVVWTEGQGGRHEGKGPDEAIAPGEAREWKVKINEGDYHMLMAKPASAGVSVIETAL